MTGTTRLEGRRALVTGGGTGIGAAIARRLVDEGAHVTITGRRVEPLEASGLPYVVADVTSTDDRARLVMEVPNVDLLVNNAGITTGDWNLSSEVHVAAPKALVDAYTESLAAAGGCVINIASVAGLSAAAGASAYAAAKAAVLQLTRVQAVELGPRGVRVNAVAPGWIRTPMADDEMQPIMERDGVDLAGAYDIVTRYLPLRRVAEPDEIAGVVAFLASSDASFITGETIVADGGGLVVDVGMLAFGD
jgi:short-subunit dehydrogenase